MYQGRLARALDNWWKRMARNPEVASSFVRRPWRPDYVADSDFLTSQALPIMALEVGELGHQILSVKWATPVTVPQSQKFRTIPQSMSFQCCDVVAVVSTLLIHPAASSGRSTNVDRVTRNRSALRSLVVCPMLRFMAASRTTPGAARFDECALQPRLGSMYQDTRCRAAGGVPG